MLDQLAHALRTHHPDRPAVLHHTRTGATRTRIRRGDLADLADELFRRAQILRDGGDEEASRRYGARP